jgi:hypothetical protein
MTSENRWFALTGAIWGLLVAAFVGSIVFLNAPGPERGFTVPNIAFLISFATPFVLALVALRFSNPYVRSAVWFGVGALTLLRSFVAFSGITLLFLPSAGLLLTAAFQTWRQTRDMLMSTARALGTAVLMLSIVPVGIASFVSLHASDDPRCWALVSRDGREVWESRPAGGGGSLGVSLSAGERMGSCTSDATTTSEGLSSLLVWLVSGPTILGFAFALDRQEQYPQGV